MLRLEDKPKKLVQFSGPVAISVFPDGTLLVASPTEAPVLIRNGALMRPVAFTRDGVGDVDFRYVTVEPAP